ncbi:ricin-type beta-trefoil lectin domain protein [Streptomyces sp. NPDC005481]|uniref:ricin-type beta-trefoil lectin domain protein n=1 Tax=Streptomyces sp. NPDC005481 TaxID=3154881 RepID=UPI0033A98924
MTTVAADAPEPGTDPVETAVAASTERGTATTRTGEAGAASEPGGEPAGTTAAAAEGKGTSSANSAESGAASEPTTAEADPDARTENAEAEGTTAPDRTAEPDAESDPGAAAAAKSRLPALVRTMTATAIDRPQQEARPVGRPGRAVLAGAAVAGALLVSAPLLMLGGNDDKDRKGPASAGTVLGGDAQEAPGEFAAATPGTRSPDADAKDSGDKKKPKKGSSASPAAKAPERGGSKDTGDKEQPKKRDGGTSADSGKDQPAKAGSGVTLGAPVTLRSHLSGRCVDVPGSDFSDGKQLVVWDCNGSDAQKWRFASDGTVRTKGGLCLDVAGANYNDGTPIQIAWCSDNNAQKFVLNASHDLVNTVVGKCVDIRDNNRGNGAQLQLWSCAGTDNQKWSV